MRAAEGEPALVRDVAARRQWIAFAIGLLVVLAVAYGPVLTRGPFGINDDYQYLYRTHQGTFDPIHNELAGMGRPVLACLYQAAYGACDGRVGRLVGLRIVSLVGIGFFGWSLARMLASLRYPRSVCMLAGTLAILSPACGVMAAWGAAAFAPWALLAALVAGRMLIEKEGWRADVGAALLLVLACATWQAAATAVLFPALAQLWQRVGGSSIIPPLPRKPWWRVWLISGLGVASYLVACRLQARILSLSDLGIARSALSTDLVGKARLLPELLRSGFDSWARLAPGVWEWVISGITGCVCIFATIVRVDGRINWRPTLERAGLGVAFLLLSIAPLLVAREDNASFRALALLYTAVAFLAANGVSRITLGWVGGFPLLPIFVIVVATVLAARERVWRGLVEPSSREYIGVRDTVRQRFPDGPPAALVYLVPPYRLIAADPMTTSWEYGLTSSAFWWITQSYLAAAFDDAAGYQNVKPFETWIFYRTAGHDSVPVLDPIPAILREEGVWRDDPHWGRVRQFSGGWQFVSWFGYFNGRYYPFIWHHVLGSITLTGDPSPGQEIWFYHEGFGYFSTSPATYPHLRLSTTDHTFTVADQNPGLLFFTDDQTGAHLRYLP